MYTAYTIRCSAELTDILVAWLGDAGFDSFEETDDGLVAYRLSERHADSLQVLQELKTRNSFTYTHDELEEKNWNEIWERSFQPIRIGDRLSVRAHFHPPVPEVTYDLVIDPKMSFGTGHHATTHMMCELILEHFAANEGVPERALDFGCGTGILGILLLRSGAKTVDAVDIEPWAVENSRENATTNGVTFNRLVTGTLSEIVTGDPYDLVLANINRNVLLASGATLRDNIRAGGRVFLSGILRQDENRVVEHYRALGFTHLQTVAREDWRAVELLRE